MESQPDVIYQVTLPSGMVVTSPHEFGLSRTEFGSSGPIVTLDGRVLVPPLSAKETAKPKAGTKSSAQPSIPPSRQK